MATNEELAKQIQLEQEIKALQEERLKTLNDIQKEAEITAEINKKHFQLEESYLLKEIKLITQKKELEAGDQESLEKKSAELAKLRIQEENRNKLSKKAAEDREKELKRLEEIKVKYIGLVKVDENRLLKSKGLLNQLKEVLNVTTSISKQEARATLFAKLQESSLAVLALVERQAIAFDKLTADLNKATNTSGKYNDAISSIAVSNARFGITAEDAAKAIGSLHTEFSDFSGMSESVQTDLANTTAQLEKAGIAADATAKFMNTATKSMGMGAQQAAKYEKELVAFAHANEISTKTINDGLASVMPRLAAFGRQGPAIFKEMAFRSKALGIEMGKLLDITEKFTTFEGAAEAAGNLNSVLGGNYIDTLGLLRAASEDPVKAQDMLRDALQKTGKSFDQLTGQQRRMFAEMLGMDVNTAGAFFKKTSLEAKQAADAEKTFNDAVASFIPIGDKLTAIGAKMAPVFQFVAKVVGTLVDVFAMLLDLPGATWFVTIGGAILTLAGVVISFTTVFGGFIISLIANLATVGTALGILGPATAAAGTTIAAAGAEAAAGGAGFAAAGTQTAAGAATGAAGLTGFVAAATPLIPALVPLAGVLGMLALAFLAMSLPIALIVLGVIGLVLAIAFLVDLLIKGGESSITAAVAFGILSVSLYGLAAALGTLGTLGAVGVGVLAVLSVVMLAFGASFLLVGEGMSMAKEGFDAITNFEITKLESIRNVMKEMANYMERVAAATALSSGLLVSPLMIPLIAAVAAIPTNQQVTEDLKTTSTAITGESNNSRPIEANVTIEMPVTLNGKELKKEVIKTVVQLNANGNPMSNVEPSTTTMQGTDSKAQGTAR